MDNDSQNNNTQVNQADTDRQPSQQSSAPESANGPITVSSVNLSPEPIVAEPNQPKLNKSIIYIILVVILIVLIASLASVFLLSRSRVNSNTSNSKSEGSVVPSNLNQVFIGAGGFETTEVNASTGDKIQFNNQTDNDFVIKDKDGSINIAVPANGELVFPLLYQDGTNIVLYSSDNPARFLKINIKENK